MSKLPRVLVVANITADHQESMIRYSNIIASIYAQFAFVRRVEPPFFFGSVFGFSLVLRKYLGYIDKLVLFPIRLKSIASSYDFIHVADHGNAYYSLICPRSKTIITCHDLLAARASFGDTSTSCTPSFFGIWLQRLILLGLRRAGTVIFVSDSTRRDYLRLIGSPREQRHLLIPNPLNAPFSADSSAFSLTPAEESLIPQKPFLLMVGSSLPRKNRSLALQILEKLGSNSNYMLVFAGAPLTRDEENFRINHHLGNRLVSIKHPSHPLLNSLYCNAHALLFPSFAEGFGWPLLEAQCCCCPVIASSTTSIPEVAGAGALYADPTNADAFAAHVRSLEQTAVRSRLIYLGSINVKRFSDSAVAEAYRTQALQL